MGVPKFYRFISERYPLINAPLRPSSAPRIDNLYLDMNGIIHNCIRTVPGNGASQTNRYSTSVPPPPKSHQQIFLDVFKYTDNLVNLIGPSKVLYMAIDGVAPRAKMNQQRARRFRSAKERLDEHNHMVAQDPMYAASKYEPFDSNCITPGTHFMYKLTEALKYFITKKLTEDVNWANLQVILSGAEAPGEGEHKIMTYIRTMRESGRLPANTRHCVYGLDADLILLGLVTHEPHFFVLREKVDFNSWRKRGSSRLETALDTTVFGEFELLSIGLLREYLVLEIGADGNSDLSFFDVERITDDFVFILMLIGNDFLPSLPTLNIADGTIDVMLHLYKRVLPRLGGYLTHTGKINGNHLEYFFAKLGLLEEAVLRKKLEDESSGSGRRGRQGGGREKTFANVDFDELFGFNSFGSKAHPLSPNQLQIECLLCKEKVDRIDSLKRDYYAEKFGREYVKGPGLEQLSRVYLEGIAWTLKYYTEGCRQWRWFYPEHYAPLSSDVSGFTRTLRRYEEGIVADRPFRPFEQLMSVLPPVSSWCLPHPYQNLMKSSKSPIRDLYPEHFRTDMNGKRNDWEAIVLLPFIDEARLMASLLDIPAEALSPEEARRNEFGPSYVYHRNVDSKATMESPFGMSMPSFVHQTKRKNLVVPRIAPGKPFTAVLLPGTKSAKSSEEFADLPTLHEFQHRSRLEPIGVNVFGYPSKSDSLILEIRFGANEDKEAYAESSANHSQVSILDKRGVAVGSSAWCGYPWRVAASVESIRNELVTKRVFRGSQSRGNQVKSLQIESMKTNKENFAQDVKVIASSLLQKCAVAIPVPKQIVTVRQVKESTGRAKEELIQTYHDHFITPRLSDLGRTMDENSVSKRLMTGMSVLYVGHGCYFGHKGTVISQGANGLVRVQFDKSRPAAKEPAFGYRVVSVCGSQERWLPMTKFVTTVGMKVPVVTTFLGSLRVRLSNGKDEVDLGLGVKYSGRQLYVPSFARPGERGYFLLSQKCANLLRNYSKAFPALFAILENLKREEPKNGGLGRGSPFFEARDLFPDSKKPDQSAKAVSTWISTQEVANLPLVSSRASILTRDTVNELQRHCRIALELQNGLDEISRKAGKSGVVKDVDIGSLLTGHEGLEWGTDAAVSRASICHAPVNVDGSDLRVGDRVVNRIGSGGVPLGLRGTVVGIYPPEVAEGAVEIEGDEMSKSQALVEVCFDENFIGGGSLGNRCSVGRGKAVYASSLFIIRPDRENPFYVKNYAQIAARIGSTLKRKAGEDGDMVKKDAIAEAAVKSYAAIVKKKPSTIPQAPVAATSHIKSGIRREGTRATGGYEYAMVPENLPLPSFLRSQGSSQQGARTGRHACRGVPHGKTNGGATSEAALIEQQLRAALEKEEVTAGSGSELRGSSSARLATNRESTEGGSRTDIADEDEFVAIWRRLQVSHGEKRDDA